MQAIGAKQALLDSAAKLRQGRAHGSFSASRRRPPRRRRSPFPHRRRGRHAGLCLFARDLGAPCPRLSRCAERARPSAHRLCGQIEPQSRRPARVGERGLWGRCRLGRRTGAGAGGGHEAGRRRVQRCREDPRRTPPGARSRNRTVQYRERGRGLRTGRDRATAGDDGPLRLADQSRCRCRYARKDLDRQAREQVRRPL